MRALFGAAAVAAVLATAGCAQPYGYGNAGYYGGYATPDPAYGYGYSAPAYGYGYGDLGYGYAPPAYVYGGPDLRRREDWRGDERRPDQRPQFDQGRRDDDRRQVFQDQRRPGGTARPQPQQPLPQPRAPEQGRARPQNGKDEGVLGGALARVPH